MIAGLTLQALGAELVRQRDAKQDFVVGREALRMVLENTNDEPLLKVNGHGAFPLTDLAHDQVAARLEIPAAYYARMRTEAPALLRDSVNQWLTTEAKPRLVRLLDQRVRAVLSGRYRPLDNFELAEAVLPSLERAGAEVVSAQVTERRLYIQARCPKLAGEVAVGDVVQAGLTVSNSEVGLGSARIEPLLYRLVCKNGMIMPSAIRQHHVGRGYGGDSEDDNIAHMLTDETKAQDSRAFWLKVRDVVAASLTELEMEKHLTTLRGTTQRHLGDVATGVEVLGAEQGLTEPERGSVLQHLAAGGDLSQWGLANAITATANTVRDYDRAVDLERLGGVVAGWGDAHWERFTRTPAPTRRARRAPQGVGRN